MGTLKPDGQKSRYTEEEYKHITELKWKYRQDHYIQKSLRVKSEQRDAYRSAAEKAGMTLNSWMLEACRRYAEREA